MFILQETGDAILLESGDNLLLEWWDVAASGAVMAATMAMPSGGGGIGVSAAGAVMAATIAALAGQAVAHGPGGAPAPGTGRFVSARAGTGRVANWRGAVGRFWRQGPGVGS